MVGLPFWPMLSRAVVACRTLPRGGAYATSSRHAVPCVLSVNSVCLSVCPSVCVSACPADLSVWLSVCVDLLFCTVPRRTVRCLLHNESRYENGTACTCGFFATVGLVVGDYFYYDELLAALAQLVLCAVQLGLLATEFRHWMAARVQYGLTAPPEIFSVIVRYIPDKLRCEVR